MNSSIFSSGISAKLCGWNTLLSNVRNSVSSNTPSLYNKSDIPVGNSLHWFLESLIRCARVSRVETQCFIGHCPKILVDITKLSNQDLGGEGG